MRLVSLAFMSLVACGSKTTQPDAAPVAPPTAAAPTTAAPTTAQPTTAQPTTAQPTTAQPTTTAEADAAVAPAEPDAVPPTATAAMDDVAPGTPELAEPAEPAAPPPPALPEPVAVGGECIKNLVDGAGIGWTAVVDGKLRLCRWDGMSEGPGPECWVLDLAAKTLAKTEIDKELARVAKGGEWQPTWPDGLKVEDEGKKATWCPTKDECHALELGEAGIGQADAKGDRLLVAPRPDAGTEGKPLSAFVFDGTGKKVGTIPLATTEESGCPDVAWAGSSVWVTLGVCAGPGAVGWLADPTTGQRRAWFGGATDKESAASAYGVEPVMVSDEVAAFREQYGNSVIYHDTTSGAVIRKVDLRASQGKDPDTGELRTGDPEEGAMELVGSTLVVTQGGGARGTLVLLDAASGKVTDVLKLQACKE